MTKTIDIEKLSLIIRIKNLPEDTEQYIEDISTLFNNIPMKLDQLEFEMPEKLISSVDFIHPEEISHKDLSTKEGGYFVSKRSVS